MPISRRTVLAAAGTGLASLKMAGAAASAAGLARTSSVTDKEVAALVKLSEESNAALMRGDMATYLALITLTDDFTLMAPFGGKPTRGAEITKERMEAMGRFFRNGTLEMEVVQSYRSADLVVLAIIERAHVEVGGLAAQDWSLRVTLVYRRVAGQWQLAHRHADPLVKGISLEQAAAIARG